MNPAALIHPDTLLIAVAVACGVLLACMYRLTRELARQREEMAHAGSALGELLERCEQQLACCEGIAHEMKSVKRRLASRAAPAHKESEREATARKLARAGAGVEALMSRCNLSRSEAELVMSVHGGGLVRAA